jgi:hypothetical protein
LNVRRADEHITEKSNRGSLFQPKLPWQMLPAKKSAAALRDFIAGIRSGIDFCKSDIFYLKGLQPPLFLKRSTESVYAS